MNRTLIHLGLLFVLALFSAQKLAAKTQTADLVVFSYDRPIQLYAFLESVERHITGLEKQSVIYRTSTKEMEEAYQEVMRRFPNASYHKQSNEKAHADFKKFVPHGVYAKSSKARYVLFGVDDLIVKDSIDIDRCIEALKQEKAWGYYLRLGKNISYTYSLNLPTPVPQGIDRQNGVFVWEFQYRDGDWCYPNSVDMTLYQKEAINAFLKEARYTTPNTLEDCWAQDADYQRKGICSLTSKVVNIPVNQVAEVTNRCLNSHSTGDLLRIFQQGLKIDISAFYQIENQSAHADLPLTFVPR